MKRFLILCGSILFTLLVRGQQEYFLFFQSENNQPYYIQVSEKTFSSSPVGHLIIPGLRDSVYSVSIGFPKDIYPEQLFQIRINKKDAGYQLKNTGQEGWVLQNFQTLQLIKPQVVASKKQAFSYGDVKKTDVFSTLMAGLVNDSAVLYTSIAKIEPAKENIKPDVPDTQNLETEVVNVDNPKKSDKPDVTTEVVNPDQQQRDTAKSSVANEKDDNPNTDTLNTASRVNNSEIKAKDSSTSALVKVKQSQEIDSVNNTTSARSETSDSKKPKTAVVNIRETKTSTGTEMVFTDMNSPGKADTIQIFIPFENPVANNNPTDKPPVVENVIIPDSAIARQESARKDVAVKEKEKQKDPQPENDKQSGGLKNFFSRIFGKGSKQGKDKNQSPEKTSSIRVIDVEDKSTSKSDSTKQITKTSDGLPREEVKNEPTGKESKKKEKQGIGKFFAKIFRKREKDETKDDVTKKQEAADNSSSIKVTPVESSVSDTKSKQPAVTNSDCRETATDGDVDRLRNKMLGEKDADGQVTEARKVFKLKCFSTKQIKALSELFRTDEGKYKLFDAAYPFVSDTNNFKDLGGLLSEEYYINRFKAMVRM